MSGGIAYVLDMDSTLYTRVNKAMVKIRRVTDKYDVQELKGMIQEHVSYTNSEVANGSWITLKIIFRNSRRSSRKISRR